jgi:hypothetical protein
MFKEALKFLIDYNPRLKNKKDEEEQQNNEDLNSLHCDLPKLLSLYQGSFPDQFGEMIQKFGFYRMANLPFPTPFPNPVPQPKPPPNPSQDLEVTIKNLIETVEADYLGSNLENADKLRAWFFSREKRSSGKKKKKGWKPSENELKIGKNSGLSRFCRAHNSSLRLLKGIYHRESGGRTVLTLRMLHHITLVRMMELQKLSVRETLVFSINGQGLVQVSGKVLTIPLEFLGGILKKDLDEKRLLFGAEVIGPIKQFAN